MEQVFLKFIKIVLGVNRTLANSHTTGKGSDLTNPLNTLSVADILDRVLQWLVGVSIPIVAILIVVGGYQIMFAGGEPDKVQKGRKIITYAVIGLAVVLLSYSAIALLKYFLGTKE